MATPTPLCQTIRIFAFRGDRTNPFAGDFLRDRQQGKAGISNGPSMLECLLHAGHAGVSIDDGATIYGFNPDGASLPVWKVLDELESGVAFPGVVLDDTAVFTAARSHPLPVESIDIRVPSRFFSKFETSLDGERLSSEYTYGFPNGDGDCNCVTWIERLGLPLLTGRMDEFVLLKGIARYPTRRFGKCL